MSSPITEGSRPAKWWTDLVSVSKDIRLFDFAMFTLLPMDHIWPDSPVPLSEVAAAAITFTALNRRPVGPRLPGWYVLFSGMWLAWVYYVAISHHVIIVKRLGHITLWVLLMLSLSSGRLPKKSAIAGIGFGISLGIISGLGLVQHSNYQGRLTGWMSDPNTAGSYMICLGVVSMAYIQTTARKWALGILLSFGIFATFSRTTIMAWGVVLLWVAVARRMNAASSLALGYAIYWAITHIPDTWKVVGPFDKRSGSDALRERILILEQQFVARAPWTGSGPGTARLVVDGQPFFFHSSFLAMQAEIGLIGLILFLILIGFLILYLLRQPKVIRNPWLEAAVLGWLICSQNIGESLLTMPSAAMLGMVLAYAVERTTPKSDILSVDLPEHLRVKADGSERRWWEVVNDRG